MYFSLAETFWRDTPDGCPQLDAIGNENQQHQPPASPYAGAHADLERTGRRDRETDAREYREHLHTGRMSFALLT